MGWADGGGACGGSGRGVTNSRQCVLDCLELMTRTVEAPPASVLALFARGAGYLTASEARAAGVYPKLIDRLVRRGLVERVQRGVYRLLEIPPPTHADLLEVQLRAPFARPCLATALDLHGLTTTRPARLQFAVPRHRMLPDITYPPLEVFYWGAGAYAHGVTSVPSGGRELVTYTIEKTLADLLKYAPKLGPELYYEGLKNYLSSRRHPDTRALLDAARVNRVEPELRRDLEVLRHEANA